MIIYSHQIYGFLSPYLGIFERKVSYKESELDLDGGKQSREMIVFGLGRFDVVVAQSLQRAGTKVK